MAHLARGICGAGTDQYNKFVQECGTGWPGPLPMQALHESGQPAYPPLLGSIILI